MKRQFFDIIQLSEYLSFSKSFLYKLVANNQIPHHKIGKRIIFDVDEINEWVKQSNSTSIKTSPLTLSDYKPFLD